MRADTRAIMSFHATPAFEISKNDYWINYEYTLGVQFLFGGKKPVVAKVEPPPPPPAPKAVEPPPPPPHRLTARSVPGPTGVPAPPPVAAVPRPVPVPVTTQPANGGAPCPSLSESKSCNTQACMEEEKINLLIEFDFDKAVVKKEFYPNADAVGAFLKKNEQCEYYA